MDSNSYEQTEFLQKLRYSFYSNVKARAVDLYRAITAIGVLTGLAPSDNFGDGHTSVKVSNVQLCTALNERRPFKLPTGRHEVLPNC